MCIRDRFYLMFCLTFYLITCAVPSVLSAPRYAPNRFHASARDSRISMSPPQPSSHHQFLIRSTESPCRYCSGSVSYTHLDVYKRQSPDIELATTDLITPMAANNLGVGFVPRAFARSALEEGSVFQIRLTETVPEREICVISRTDTPLSLAGNAFLRLFSDFAEPSCIKKDCR